MSEEARKKAQEAYDTLAKMDRSIDQQLTDTEWQDKETLESYAEVYAGDYQVATEIQQAQYRQQLRQVKANPAFVAKLKSRGMTPSSYLDALEKNPNAYQQTYAQGEDDLLDRLQGRTPKSRRAQEPKGIPGLTDLTEKQKAAMEARAKKGTGTSDDMADLIALMIPDDDPLLRS